MAKTEIERKISAIYKALFDHTISVDELVGYSNDIIDYYDYLMDMNNDNFRDINHKTLAKFIEINLIYYTYSENGEALITDSQYDNCMKVFMMLGYPQMTTTDYELKEDSSKKWKAVLHAHPNMVGSLDKEYGIATFIEKLLKMSQQPGATGEVIFVPKYDGTSCCINIENGKFKNAVTRKDGQYGLDVSKVVKSAKNFEEVWEFIEFNMAPGASGALKCEMLCATEDFQHISDKYANRRSAASAIVSAPKNVGLSPYLTIMPIMLYLDNPSNEFLYASISGHAKYSGYVYVNPYYKPDMIRGHWFIQALFGEMSVSDACQHYGHEIEELLTIYRDPSFPFRVDGVVAHCVNRDPSVFSSDAMATTLAYKVNTATGITRVLEGYISIGRGGRATPMVKVEPCDCNETVVQDVSLSNMSKVKKFDLRIGDTIEIESAGDVIPMVKRVIKHKKHAEPIKFKNKCPYCGEPLEKISDELIGCTNRGCPRIISGQAATFFERMGVKGFSDLTFENLLGEIGEYTTSLKFIDVLTGLETDDIMELDGWDYTKAQNFVAEISNMMRRPIDEAKFLAAINIPDVGPKTTQKIIEKLPFSEIDKYISKGKPSFLEDVLMDADGCGYKTAQKITSYLFNNWEDIMRIKRTCNIIPYTKHLGSFALTGFSGAEKDEIARDLEVLGYDVGGVTKSTIACVALHPDGSSDKIKKARKYGIPIISRNDIKRFIANLG